MLMQQARPGAYADAAKIVEPVLLVGDCCIASRNGRLTDERFAADPSRPFRERDVGRAVLVQRHR